MSRIVPKLNLNKTPQLVENNSLVMAKNIRLLEDGTIGPDTSLEEIENKSGDSHEYDIHHDAVIEEKTTYEYTILDFQSTISVIRDGSVLNPNTISDNAFDFNEYGHEQEGQEPEPNRFKYVRMHPDYPCHIHCYKHFGEEVELVQERFSYSTNHNALITSSGYWLFIAICQEIYNNTQEPINNLKRFYYVILPQSYNNFVNGNPQTINIKKFNYVVLNPVYQTSIVEQIVIHEAYDEHVIQYNTPKYIGQIVGLDNKVYFFREDIAVMYSEEVRAAINKHYPNEKFIFEDKIPDKEATFDVNSENYVTRKGELFEDREVAEEVFSNFNNRARIIEYDEVENTFTRVKCAWHYNGGKINGCVTVNGTGEYILTICEYDVPGGKLVPIKHINLAKCKLTDDESFYTQAPNIPITNLINIRRYVKTIPAGVYQFFIRYKIHENFYTNWLPCSKELFAASMKRTDTLQGSLKHIDLHEDANYSFIFQVEHLFTQHCSKFEQFQLGFIISSEGGIFARSWKHFDMTTANKDIYFEYNQEDIEEINIDDLLKVNYDIFNVGNVAAYKNKLYISNYTETDFNEQLQSYAKDIKIKLKLQEVFVNSGSDYYFTNIPLHETEVSYNPAIYDKFGTHDIKDTFGENNYCNIEVPVEEHTEVQDGDYMDYNNSITEEDMQNIFYNRITKVYIKYNNTRYYLPECGNDLEDADIQLNGWDTHSIIEQFTNIIKDNIIGIDSNGNYKAILNGDTINVSEFCIEYTTYRWEYDDKIPDDIGYGQQDYHGYHMWHTTNKITEVVTLKDIISSSPSFSKEYREYNTLLPFTKYDFYVHYVKQNGIVTNGYFIGTKEVKRYCKGYKRIVQPPGGASSIEVPSIENIDDISKISSNTPKYIRYNNSGTIEFYELTEDGLTDKSIIYPSFSNIKCPPGYVGCFISISKYGNKVAQAFNCEVSNDKISVVRLDCLELDCLLYNTLHDITVIDSSGAVLSDKASYYSSSTTNPLEHLGGSGHIEFTSNEQQAIVNKWWIIFESTKQPYNKTLIKVTPYINLKKTQITSYDNYEDVNSPGYLCEIQKLNRTYCNGSLISGSTNPTGYYVSGTDIYTREINSSDDIDLEEVDSHVDYHYNPSSNFILSNFNLNYVSLTQDLNPIVRRYNEDTSVDPPTTNQQYITVVDSLICSFILELKSIFKDYTKKLYYEYVRNKVIRFDNTIRCSNIDVDEVYRYIYRFEATDYYNVPKQRGIITNLISIANSIYVHCEHSLFKFSDNKTLNAESEEVTLQENDIFNSGITEVFDAQYGYAGLKKREQSLITYNAYVFYDEVAKTVYAFGGEQQIGNISEPIKKLIKVINPTDVQFLGDEPHNRFFINFRNNLGNVCISFNFNSKSFVSVHDIDFKFGFHSRRHSYVVRENIYDNQVTGWSIYKIIDVLRTELIRTDQPMPPDPSSFTYVDNYIAYQNCYKKSLIHIADCDDNTILNEVNSVNACVDIICNTEYEAIKVLNYISWICSEIIQYGENENNVSEEVIDKHYPAHKIRIYSDSTETSLFDLLDSNGNPKIANENTQYFDNAHQRANSRAWQYPQYNCGVWSMNYFRDIKNIDDIFDYMDAENGLIGEEGYSGTSQTTNLMPFPTRQNLTQENSLLYGKYFVVRFIFNNKNFKLENVILRMNDYGKTK